MYLEYIFRLKKFLSLWSLGLVWLHDTFSHRPGLWETWERKRRRFRIWLHSMCHWFRDTNTSKTHHSFFCLPLVSFTNTRISRFSSLAQIRITCIDGFFPSINNFSIVCQYFGPSVWANFNYAWYFTVEGINVRLNENSSSCLKKTVYRD